MTYEIQAETLCDHRVHREFAVMDWIEDLDYRTLRIPQPISSDNVRVWINEREILKTDSDNPWELVLDETSTPVDPLKKIVFKKPVYNYYSFFEISYTVRSHNCRKCFGLDVLYDHAYDKKGRLITIQNEQMLIQVIIKHLLTKVRSNPYYTWIGSSIPNILYRAIRDIRALQQQLLTDVTITLQKIKNTQNKQAEVQSLDLRQVLNNILDVQVTQPIATDPRYFVIAVEVDTGAGDTVLIERQLVLGEDKMLSAPLREAGI